MERGKFVESWRKEGDEITIRNLSSIQAQMRNYRTENPLIAVLDGKEALVMESESLVLRSLIHGSHLKETPETIQELPSQDLTQTEQVIYDQLKNGMSNKEISVATGYALSTVKNNMSSIFKKLDVKSRTQAVIYALQSEYEDEDSA